MKRFLIKYKYLHLWLLTDLFLLGVFLLMRQSRAAMNALTRHFTDPLRERIGMLCSYVPFSVAECLYVLFFAGLILFAVYAGRAIFRSSKKGECIYALLLKLFNALISLYLLFCLLWGANYYADGFRARSGLRSEAISTEALYETTRYFAEQVNAHAGLVPRGEDETAATAPKEILSYAPFAYSALYEEFPFLECKDGVPKAMLFSKVMSAMGFTGFYFPFTGESHINVDFPTATMPTTVTHELAHRRGIASEQECNFLGILAAVRTDNAVYNYSGWLSGYNYLSNALYSASPELYREIRATLDARVLADLRASSEYWAQFEGPVEKVSSTVYDGFLKSYGNPLGVRSYGACVDLLVAYFGGK